MDIYRIENSKGNGFYHDSFYVNFPPVQYWYDIFEKCTDEFVEYALSIIHPRINGIDWNTLSEHHVHGFSSFNDLKRWFPKNILYKIEENGGFIKKFTVPDDSVLLFKRQCIFDKRHVISETNILL